MKKQRLLKTLLVAASLFTGVSAWATTDDYGVDLDAFDKTTYDFTTMSGDLVIDKTSAPYSVWSTKANSYKGGTMNVYPCTTAGMTRFAFEEAGGDAWYFYGTNGLCNKTRVYSAAVTGLKSGNIVVFVYTMPGKLNFGNTAAGVGPYTLGDEVTVTAQTTIYDGRYYRKATMTADGVVGFDMNKWSSSANAGFVRQIHVYTAKGVCAEPTYQITGANGNARTFDLSCSTDESTIYYSTSELATATGGTEYTSAVNTEATTIWAYAKTSTSTSSVICFSTGAGSTLSLATPAITASGFTNTDGTTVNSPTFNFTCNNGAIIGTPTATLSYTFTPAGGVESAATEGTSYAPTTYGTLKVIASAAGYASSEKTLTVSNRYVTYFTGRDYSTATTADISATWGDPYSVTWTGWETGLTATLASKAISDDQHLRIQNDGTISLVSDWGFVRGDQKAYGYSIRYVKEGEFVAFKENTSKGADASATTYQTAYCGNGTGVIGDMVTISVPAGYALQQLFHYAPVPANESIEISAAGMATYVSTYNLDFTDTDIKAYTAKVSSKATCTLTEIKKVPAGTPVLLIGSTDDIPVAASTDAVGANDLVAGTGAAVATEDGGYTNMILNNIGGNVGFYFAAGNTVASNRAYLHFNSSLAPAGSRMTLLFGDDTTTGINSVENAKTVDGIYNLNGQRVAQPTRGLYIVNGKKVVVP